MNCAEYIYDTYSWQILLLCLVVSVLAGKLPAADQLGYRLHRLGRSTTGVLWPGQYLEDYPNFFYGQPGYIGYYRGYANLCGPYFRGYAGLPCY